jgi:para-nitrobenzyl esterase
MSVAGSTRSRPHGERAVVSGPEVETAQGRIAGAVDAPDGRAVLRFLGIPYAAPPVGHLRWRPPQPPASWTGVRDALAFGPAAPQAAPLATALPGFRADPTTPDSMSEDCLTLNVWTPSLDGARPVMVWLHGGAYTNGASSQPVYDAARLASEGDVVVVTLNYRLGVLGFLALPGAHDEGDAVANCGLRDQLAALAWVREHAARLGGDPRRITVFGESAGAGSVLHLLASSATSGAFDRAIAQSGEPRTLTPEQAEMVAEQLARHLGLAAADAAALRTVPVDRLVAAQADTALELVATIGLMPYGPVLDGDVCDLPVTDGIAAGRADGVDVIVSTMRDELLLFPDPRSSTLDDGRLSRRAATIFGTDANAQVAIDAYRSRPGRVWTNGDVWEAMRTDAMMRIPNLRVADAHAARAPATFVARFDWEAPGLGAAHGVDVPFTFGTFDREGWDAVIGHDARAEAVGVSLRRAWTTFAADGTPLPGGGIDWPAYGPPRRSTMLFTSDGCCAVDDPDAGTRSLFA